MASQARQYVRTVAPLCVKVVSPAASNSSTNIFAANPARCSFTVQNLSSAPLTIFGVDGNGSPAQLAVIQQNDMYYDDEYVGVVTCSGSSINYSANEYNA